MLSWIIVKNDHIITFLNYRKYHHYSIELCLIFNETTDVYDIKSINTLCQMITIHLRHLHFKLILWHFLFMKYKIYEANCRIFFDVDRFIKTFINKKRCFWKLMYSNADEYERESNKFMKVLARNKIDKKTFILYCMKNK